MIVIQWLPKLDYMSLVLGQDHMRFRTSGHVTSHVTLLLEKWNRFIDINNTFLNFKLLVRHGQTRSDKNLISHDQAGLAITSYLILVNAAFKLSVHIMPSSYKINIAKALQYTSYLSYITIKRKKKDTKARIKIKKCMVSSILG